MEFSAKNIDAPELSEKQKESLAKHIKAKWISKSADSMGMSATLQISIPDGGFKGDEFIPDGQEEV